MAQSTDGIDPVMGSEMGDLMFELRIDTSHLGQLS